MRKLLLAAPLVAAIVLACSSQPPVGPGVVMITETTTSMPTTSTTTIAAPTVAAFTFSPVTPEVLQLVIFDASTSTAGTNRTIVRYDWDFGDGEQGVGVKDDHDYVISGTYLVTLTVTDNTGQQVKSSQPITVRPKLPTP
jgi:PKD repeat protein